MLNVKFDTTMFTKTMRNAVAYSLGFTEGIQKNRLKFNTELAEFTKEALYKYIDAQARANHSKLHHVYEPGATGSPSARLYQFDAIPTIEKIIFVGNFLPSSGIPNNGGYPLVDRANIMENQISLTIAPKNADFLAFEYNGDMVFTAKTIYIAHPGGDGVANGFGSTVDTFFTSYFTNALLAPLLQKLQRPTEFGMNFAAGARGGGRPLGIRTGQDYLDIIGGIE